MLMTSDMINCSREKYRQALAERVPTKAESEVLKAAAERIGFRHLQHGRQISPRTWIQALRADRRGHLAFPRLGGCACLCRLAKQNALTEQRALFEKLLSQCPDFFSGLLVTRDAESLGSRSETDRQAAE